MSIIDGYDFTHHLDRQTLDALKAIPGFTQVTKAYMRLVSDRQFHLNNMSSKMLLGPNQIPEIYNLLPPVCERLGIEEPPLYLELDVDPNAYTRGENLPEITLTSGLLDYLSKDEIQVVIAHECGHIICHHVLYHQIGAMVLSGASAALGIPLIGEALRYAFLAWMRCSEFSADRAAALFAGSSEAVAKIMMRFAGCPSRFDDSTSLELFMRQAESYEMYMNDSGWNKFLGTMAYAENTHPLNAVRANEVTRWMSQPEVQQVVNDLNTGVFKPTVTYFGGQGGAPGGYGGGQGNIPTGYGGQGATPAGYGGGHGAGPGGYGNQNNAPGGQGAAPAGYGNVQGAGPNGASGANPQYVTCPKCGAANQPGSAFCCNCGNHLDAPWGGGGIPPQGFAPSQPPMSSTDKIRWSLGIARKR